MGALFHFLRYGFVCRPYFPVRNPPGSVLSPFQGLQIHLCKRELCSVALLAALQHLTNSPL